MIAEYFFDCPKEEEITNEMPTLQILNGTSDFSKLEEVVNKYKEKGYNILKVGNTDTKVKQTKVTNRTKQTSEVQEQTKSIIKDTAKIEKGKDNIKYTINLKAGNEVKKSYTLYLVIAIAIIALLLIIFEKPNKKKKRQTTRRPVKKSGYHKAR